MTNDNTPVSRSHGGGTDLGKGHVLITGGTGFFGRALLRYWISKPQGRPKVCVLSRNPEKFLAQYPEFMNKVWLSFHKGDILKPCSLPEKEEFTHVLHAAADATLIKNLTPLEQYEQILDGTRNLLDYAVKTKVTRFLLTSSGGVYGPQPENLLRIPEDYNGIPDPLVASHAYSVAKRCAEHLCALYKSHYGLETVVARCFAFVGQDLSLDVHFAIGNFIRDALFNHNIVIKSDGTPLRSYMDQRDLAHWLVTMLERGASGEAYNVGSDAEISIKDLAILVRDKISPGKEISFLFDANAKNFRNHYVPDISKARRELGLDLTYSIDESVLETANFHKKL